MSDVFQSNQITTLQHLRPNIRLEEEVRQTQRKIVVVVPCLVSHYKNQLLWELMACITTISYISEVIIVLNGAEEDLKSVSAHVSRSIERDSLPVSTLLCGGLGKGRAIKMGFDYIYHRYEDKALVATIDADCRSFSREYLLRLVYPIAVLGGQANKGYYARFSATALNGRLTRLLVFPMLYAIQEQCPTSDLNQWLLSFRYPLSGDVALASELLPHLKLEGNWAYDLSLLTSLFHYRSDNAVYQTELTDNYEHSHRGLSGSSQSGLIVTAADISDYLMRLFPTDRDRLIRRYSELADVYCSRYERLAVFNGIEASGRDRQLVCHLIDHLNGSSIS